MSMNFAQFKGAVIEALDVVNDLNENSSMDLDDWLEQLSIAMSSTDEDDLEDEDEGED